MNFKKNITAKDKSKLILITAAAVAGIICILLSFFGGKNESAASQDTYGSQLEQRLSTLIESAAPGTEVEVMITFESEYVENAEAEAFSFTSITDSSSKVTQKPTPSIKGVMIVCNGLINKSDFAIIKRAAATALGIQEKQIYIIGGVSQQ